jgi:hypothetical protein
MTETTLREIALEQGTDKEGAHTYTEAYERHLGHLRGSPITLLEIGIGGYADPRQGGASLRMWKTFFPRAQIIGLDIHDKSALAEDRITILQGDQGDKAFLERIALEHGPFDVVIDDGSHRCRHVIASFEALFPHLTETGIYAIEDLQTSYWETYGGSSGADRRGTSMTMLQGLADGVNHAEYDIPGYEPTYPDLWVQAVTFYHNLAFVQKGPNTQPSHLLPPHPRPAQRFARPVVARPGATRRAPRARTMPRSPRALFRSVVPLAVRRIFVKGGRSLLGWFGRHGPGAG